jgi:hypothetical protein
LIDQGKDGETNAHEDRRNLVQLYPLPAAAAAADDHDDDDDDDEDDKERK